jgi:hypothetical protein
MLNDRNGTILAVLLVAMAMAWGVAQNLRADTRDPTLATINYQGPVTQTDGFTFASSTTAIDILASANWPAAFVSRYTAAEQARTRWITIRNLDSTISICVAVGAGGVGSALVCDPDNAGAAANRTSGVLPAGQSVQVLLGSAASLGISAFPQVWVASVSGTPRVAIDVIF